MLGMSRAMSERREVVSNVPRWWMAVVKGLSIEGVVDTQIMMLPVEYCPLFEHTWEWC